MGRLFARLDPPGYFFPEEPAQHLKFQGPDLLGVLTRKPRTQVFAASTWAIGNWIGPRPRQADPNYYQSPNFSQSLLNAAKWVFASGINVREQEGSKPAGTSGFPLNQWMAWSVPPSGMTSLDSTNYSTLFAAAGVTAPAGIFTAAMCGVTPMGESMAGNDYMPFPQIGGFPRPYDWIVFGFQNLAMLIGKQVMHLLKSPNNDKQTWQLVKSFDQRAQNTNRPDPRWDLLPSGGVGGAGGTMRLDLYSILVHPVGHLALQFYFGSGTPGMALPTPLPFNRRVIYPGAWWFGLVPGQNFFGQVQMVTYDNLSLNLTGTDPDDCLFDLGSSYLPTVAPSISVPNGAAMMRNTIAETPVTKDSNSVDITSAFSGESISIELVDENGNAWASDGTHHRGGLQIHLHPDNPGTAPSATAGYLAPQLAAVEIVFPAKLTARPNPANVLLNDTQFLAPRFSASLNEPLGKKCELTVWDRGTNILGDLDLNGNYPRGWFPIHIEEDTDGNGVPDTIRLRGWITEAQQDILVPEGTTLPGESVPLVFPFKLITLSGSGLAAQMDDPWVFLPQLVDPDGAGYLEHADVVAECAKQSGIDITDTDDWIATLDPFTGTAFAQLPGTQDQQVEIPGIEADPPWPKWDEKKIEYASRIGRDWRGWVLCEELGGRIRYMPDLFLELFLTSETSLAKYYRRAVLYATSAAAAAAGRPKQYILGRFDLQTEEPTANVLRITGKDSEGRRFPHIIIRDEDSINNVLSYEHRLGTRRSYPVVSDLAVNEVSASVVCKPILANLTRRRYRYTPESWCAPWEFADPIDIGTVVQMPNGDDCVIVHLEVELLFGDGGTGRGNLWATRMALERVPQGSTRSVTPGAYPGAGA
jgi:hypothetical protein